MFETNLWLKLARSAMYRAIFYKKKLILSLSKELSELLASRLNEKNLFQFELQNLTLQK